MLRFLLAYLTLSFLAHFFLWQKIRGAFSLSPRLRVSLFLFMAAMTAAPVAVRITEKAGLEVVARALSHIGYTWMGLLFLFLVISAALDAARFFLGRIGASRWQGGGSFRVNPRSLLMGQLTLTVAVYGYGLYEASAIRLEKVEIANPKIPENPGRFRIVQISDVHLGLIIREKRLQKILAKIEEANPDILVSTGDLVDGQLNHLNREADLLSALKPPFGKIAITGNHEFYAGLANALEFTRQAGFTILRDQGLVTEGVNFVGVDDRALTSWSNQPLESERALLLAVPQGNFTVLLKHRPDIDPESLGLFDLQLSGHTHKGQIFPFNLLTWLAYPQRAGRLTTLDSGWLYLSRGTGTWGPPIRILAPPEITIIDLIHAR